MACTPPEHATALWTALDVCTLTNRLLAITLSPAAIWKQKEGLSPQCIISRACDALCHPQGNRSAAQAHRWALLGNAVSVQVAAWIGTALMQPHRHKYLGARDRRFVGMRMPPEAEEGELTHPERKFMAAIKRNSRTHLRDTIVRRVCCCKGLARDDLGSH